MASILIFVIWECHWSLCNKIFLLNVTISAQSISTAHISFGGIKKKRFFKLFFFIFYYFLAWLLFYLSSYLFSHCSRTHTHKVKKKIGKKIRYRSWICNGVMPYIQLALASRTCVLRARNKSHESFLPGRTGLKNEIYT